MCIASAARVPPRSASTRSTLRRRPPLARCTSATCFPTPTPTSLPASSACAARACSIQLVGTTTAYRPNAGCRTTTGCAATRACRTKLALCHRFRVATIRARRRPISNQSRDATSLNCASSSPLRMRSSSKSSGAGSASRLTGHRPTAPLLQRRCSPLSSPSFAMLSAARHIRISPRPCGM